MTDHSVVCRRPHGESALDELLRLQEGVAKLVEQDPVYLPIFARLESEIMTARAESPVERARALLARQKAMS